MIRIALAALALSGCALERVQVLPSFNSSNEIGCCVVAAEIPPSTSLMVAVTKATQGTDVKLGAKFRF
jgi:hypothetical protein